MNKAEIVDLARLRMFVAVAESRSFTKAAERLGMTKSAVSHGLSSLERELGAQLLQRSTRSVTITQAGEAFLVECRGLIAHAGQVIDRARARQGEISGLLRVTAPAEATALVAPVIAEYASLHPLMRVEYLATDELVDPLKENIDVSLRVTGVRTSGLRATGLGDLQVWCVASPAYLELRGVPKSVENLVEHDWIAFTRLTAPWSLRFRVGRRDLTVRVRGRISVSTSAAGRALAIAGAGIHGGPDFTVRADVDAGRLVRLLPEARLPPITLYAAWPGRLEPPAKTRMFIELAKARLRGQV